MKDKYCKTCGSELLLKLTPQTIHYGRLDCPKCGFYAWASNPESSKIDSLRTSKKTASQVCAFHKLPEEMCFYCLRTRKELGFAETLTCDHIQELDKGGQDIIENQQVLCSACHKLKNWLRLYLHWHFKKEDNNGKEKDI